MAFEIGGRLRPLFVAWIVAWPSSSIAELPTPNGLRQPVSREDGAPAAPDDTRSKALSCGGLSVGKRGIEYRNAFVVRRRELSYRVWGGRARKQIALGVDFEPRLRNNRLRIGAYGTQNGFGVALRLRY